MYGFYQHPVNFFVLLAILSVWELVWKGFGLWHSSQYRQKGWFIAILLLNTAGLLPIIYLLWFKPKRKRETPLKSATKSVRRKR
ncbi:hypothetical protein HYV87_02590 [Candidatus Woesearchaeota archaeon]|nr:hypothetical protein [Candidatus Woesearchaeota archaeon]MBI2581991.1 hypothetical protein [Candidatus Woesearchaeota archaeon]